MNKLPPMLWLLLAIAFCPLLTGCWESESADGSVTNDPEAPMYEDPPADPNPSVDSEDSWKKFFSKFKGTLKNPALAEEKWKEEYAAGKFKLVLLKSDPEMEYIQYGDAVDIKGINPDRIYEVGVVSLAAKEEKGADGYEIREYKLKFITPLQNGEWTFAEGLFKISSSQGPTSYSGEGWFLMNQEEFDKSYLKLLFYQPAPKEDAESK